MIKKYVLLVIVGVLMSFASVAEAMVKKQTSHNSVEISATETADQILVDVKLEPQDGWQIYSHVPGEVGLPTEAEWILGDYQLVSERWSEGEDIIYEGFGINVYKKPAYYTAVLQRGKGNLPKVKISWMACKGECVPETLFFDLTPEVFSKNLPLNSVQPLLKIKKIESKPIVTSESESLSWPKLLIFAFIGGLILNFMPCVFPILFIKIISVGKQKDKKKNIAEAFEYAGGVLLCFLIMATLLFVFKKGGAEIGWGFQLQSPVFVTIMAILFFILGLMFLDIIQLNSSLKYVPAGSFMTGFLAVLIASPCTAPFMGAAIGWVLTSKEATYLYYPVFLSLGVGYALPFFLAGIYPNFLQKIMPKPGKWMMILKKVFAIPMFATCIWLVWVLKGDVVKQEEIWQPYSSAELEEAIKNHKKVLVNFTAKWCITCLANEKALFSTQKFGELTRKHGVKLLKADWTNRNVEITRKLAEFGRSSVPLYVYYKTNGSYEILPQLPNISDFEKVFNDK